MRNNRKLLYNIMYNNIVTHTKSHWNIGRVISYFFFSHLFVAANFVSISISKDDFSLNEGAGNVKCPSFELSRRFVLFSIFVQSSHTQNKKMFIATQKVWRVLRESLAPRHTQCRPFFFFLFFYLSFLMICLLFPSVIGWRLVTIRIGGSCSRRVLQVY